MFKIPFQTTVRLRFFFWGGPPRESERTLLSQNLAISVDGADPMVYPYTFCTASGCAARLAITDNEINAFKRGNEAKMVVVPAVAPDQKVLLTISLKGFTAAYDAASKANAQ